jgi:proteasome alpha subunit
MKSAFEQVYGAPYLARMLFAEVGERPEEDLFLRVEYDGEIATNGATYARARQDFAVLSGTRQSTELMEAFLKTQHAPDASFETAFNCALDAWSIGHMTLQAIDRNNWQLPESKLHCLSAMPAGQFVIDRYRIRNCVP